MSIKLGKGPRDLNWMNEYPPHNGGVVNIPLSNELFESPTRKDIAMEHQNGHTFIIPLA